MLGVHRDTNIARGVKDWLSQGNTNHDPYNAMFWIILAMGDQLCPDDKDERWPKPTFDAITAS
jgi:hypothetical protein